MVLDMSMGSLRDGNIHSSSKETEGPFKESDKAEESKYQMVDTEEGGDESDKEGQYIPSLGFDAPPAVQDEINIPCPSCNRSMVPRFTQEQAFKADWSDKRVFICRCGTTVVMTKIN